MRPAVDDERTPPSLLYMIKQLELVVRSRLDDLLRPSGVTVLQYTALTVLRRRSGLSSAELARNSFVTAQSMSDLVGALERRGLIARERDPGDLKRLVITLTDEGAALLEELDPRVQALEEAMVAGLSPTRRATLRESLNTCRAALSDREPQ